MRPADRRAKYERYDLEQSPFYQRPTQREVAELLGETRDDLRRLVNYKDEFTIRRSEEIGGKIRELAYPVARLRAVHERFKFHLNKIKQPSYLVSPRKGRSQRDNALIHLDKDQYLTLDIKQFYPSTTFSMVRKWFIKDMRMYDDVGGLLTHISTIDGRASFGSPLTPVLCSLVHRNMFREIERICDARRLRYSVWVDDLTISGRFVPGQVLDEIRESVRLAGLGTHRIEYRSGNRPVFITGIGVVGTELAAPNSLHIRIKDYWRDYYDSRTIDEKNCCISKLLSHMGTLRYIVGRKSAAGQKVSNQMNSLRQKQRQLHKASELSHRQQVNEIHVGEGDESESPFH